MDRADMEKHADELYSKSYLCPGPSRLVGNMGGAHPQRGMTMSIIACLQFPDCGCHVYDEAIEAWEDASELERRD
ncbi:MAG: hypothetical protein Q7O66_16840 [Dehalococcoidia bacterium]|nr:hypothetical protein [Dehalococcoidia bacterium]